MREWTVKEKDNPETSWKTDLSKRRQKAERREDRRIDEEEEEDGNEEGEGEKVEEGQKGPIYAFRGSLMPRLALGLWEWLFAHLSTSSE